jgi:hypothetical protein
LARLGGSRPEVMPAWAGNCLPNSETREDMGRRPPRSQSAEEQATAASASSWTRSPYAVWPGGTKALPAPAPWLPTIPLSPLAFRIARSEPECADETTVLCCGDASTADTSETPIVAAPVTTGRFRKSLILPIPFEFAVLFGKFGGESVRRLNTSPRLPPSHKPLFCRHIEK